MSGSLDPNFKRGPPKGYIQAIEHRLKLVETVLGAIVASDDSSAKKVVTNLNKDHLAYDVLDRVHNGPYGAPAAEEAANESPTSSISTRVRHTGPGTSRPAREPRTERELMSLTQGQHLYSLFRIVFLIAPRKMNTTSPRTGRTF